MSVPRTMGWGIALAFMTALISGVAVFLNGLFVKEFPSPILLAAVRNSLVGLALLAVLVATRRARPAATTTPRQAIGLAALGIIGGGIPFALFFTGLSLVPSAGAAVIQKTMFVWVALLAVPLLGERLGGVQLAALGILLIGTLVPGARGAVTPGIGEALILLATLMWAVEVVIARRLIPAIGSLPAATARMLLGGLVLVAMVFVGGEPGAIASLSLRQWLIIGLTSLLLAGYVTSWYAALSRAPATIVTSVLASGALVTAALQASTRGVLPSPADLLALGLVLAGALLLVAVAGAVHGSGAARRGESRA
jgi:drug/metabolite transporter (DMT)-like permease